MISRDSGYQELGEGGKVLRRKEIILSDPFNKVLGSSVHGPTKNNPFKKGSAGRESREKKTQRRGKRGKKSAIS